MEARLTEPVPTPGASIGKLIAGAFFVIVGVLLTLDNLDLFEADRILRYWPAILILAGALKLILGNSSRVGAIVLILVGTWLLGDNLNLIRFSLFDLWPLVLIAGGLGLVALGFGWRPTEGAPAGQQKGSAAIFGTANVVETSSDYRGGSAIAFLGGYELDLTGADIRSGPAVVDTFAWWGGVEIFVPDNWEVIGEVVPFMGGFEVHTQPASDPSRRLIVRGVAIMGGTDVRSASRRKA